MKSHARNIPNGLNPETILLDSVTISQMAPLSERTKYNSQCDVSIKFDDNSWVKAASVRVRNVHFIYHYGRWKVK